MAFSLVVRRACRVFFACLFGLLPAVAKGEDSSPAWEYVVTVSDLSRGVIEVELTARGLPEDTQVCADMDGAERHVRDLLQVVPGPGGTREVPVKKGDECWPLKAPGGRLHLRYRFDLGALADASGDPDYASRIGDNYLFNDGAVLLRPDPLPKSAPLSVEFRLPPGVKVATPWERLPGPGWRFRYDSEQYDAGNYVALGALCPLGELPIKGGTAVLTALSCTHVASDDDLRRWVKRALSAGADFYGELPGGRVFVILAPVPGTKKPGVFGTILHRGLPSSVLFFGADAPGKDFEDDWMATHELFHLGNPRVKGRIYWFIEGFTTYYQDVLRGRSKMQPADVLWGDMYDGFRRFCDPQDGMSLGEESRRLRELHHYTRVYWGGACLAFLTDVAIREHSGGDKGLGDLFRQLRQEGQKAPLTEARVISVLEQAAGQPIIQRFLRSRGKAPLAPVYQRLGIEPTGPDTVRLHDDAPEAGIRKAIF
jgi:predicted metalloprotease with PDZ domain